jgi:hypothetical protein
MMSEDRFEDIKTVFTQADADGRIAQDSPCRWLIGEVKRLRKDVDKRRARQIRMWDRMTKARGFISKMTVEELLEEVIHQRQGALTELDEIHDLAAEALGYQRAPSREEDPNYLCPGQFITGDHTAQTLVMKLVREYNALKAMD